MNPFSFYDHKADLMASMVATGAAVVTLRRRPAGTARLVAMSGAAWGGVGLADWFIYSFGYTLASWTPRDTDAIGAGLQWLRVPVVVVLVWALFSAQKSGAEKG